MASKTPSMGIDQNENGKFIDRYWGNVPDFLVYLPAVYNCEINQDYITLIEGIIDGSIPRENVDTELYYEIMHIINNMDCPCILTGRERQVIEALLGNETCPKPSNRLNCDDAICCNTMVSCLEDECKDTPEPPISVCDQEFELSISSIEGTYISSINFSGSFGNGQETTYVYSNDYPENSLRVNNIGSPTPTLEFMVDGNPQFTVDVNMLSIADNIEYNGTMTYNSSRGQYENNDQALFDFLLNVGLRKRIKVCLHKAGGN